MLVQHTEADLKQSCHKRAAATKRKRIRWCHAVLVHVWHENRRSCQTSTDKELTHVRQSAHIQHLSTQLCCMMIH